MKLRNKKTGEIGRVLRQLRDREEIRIATDKKIYFVESLSQLADEWEDYIEPKTEEQYWFYDTLNNRIDYCEHDENDEDEKKDLEIGNHFETREEAEKAVEKLKAWKRLKDKGIEPIDCTVEHFGLEILVRFIIDKPYDEKDLVLLFGGEE